MSDVQKIVRLAARGDGVTASGKHVAGAVTGDCIDEDGTIMPGPHRVVPPCRHFPECGGCQLQHADEAALRTFVTDRVVNAAYGQGLDPLEVLPTHLSPPNTRRRTTLHAMRTRGHAILGFKIQRSNRIVDLAECHVLRPELFALVAPLRKLVARFGGSGPVEISLTLADSGVDCLLGGIDIAGLEAAEAVRDFADDNDLARLSIDSGYGAETVWEPMPVTVTLGDVQVGLPLGSFLQPTLDGEHCLVTDAVNYTEGAASVADLFAGMGTFAFSLCRQAKVLAVEAARDPYLATKAAANAGGLPVYAMHRDLFRNSLQPKELERFDAILLDPPRAGAKEQIGQLARSNVQKVVYISCNPSSWARDAKTLTDGGFRLETIRPVGQFRWSTHVELTSLFVR